MKKKRMRWLFVREFWATKIFKAYQVKRVFIIG